jgi:transcriptional regulator with XRE-family HTH domain
VFWPDLGAYFLALRDEKGWGLREAADFAARRKIEGVNYQLLHRLEKGKQKRIDASHIKGIARLYGKDFDEVTAEVTKRLYRPDSEGHQENLRGPKGNPLHLTSTAVTRNTSAVGRATDGGSSVQQHAQVAESLGRSFIALGTMLAAGRLDLRAARRLERLTGSLRGRNRQAS